MTPVQVNAAGWTRAGFLGRHRPLDTYPRDWYREAAEAGDPLGENMTPRWFGS